jgi:hypothetical protein
LSYKIQRLDLVKGSTPPKRKKHCTYRRLATGWTTRRSGSLSPGRVKIFTSPYRPDRLWGPPNLL